MKPYTNKILLFIKTIFLRFSLGIALMISLLSISCEDFVEIELPNSQITGEKVFEDVNTAEAALADVYTQLRDNSIFSGNITGVSVLLGNAADELQNFNPGRTDVEGFYNNTILPSDNIISTFWNSSYNLIFACNAIIEGISENDSISSEDQDWLIGQALFLRGFIHFHLLNLFGDIPYIESTDYRINQNVQRVETNMVYAKIITDVKTAIELLPEEYSTTLRIIPNKFVGKAFLSRVALYNQQWELAFENSSAVIEQVQLYQLSEDVNTVFLRDSPSTIWQLDVGTPGANTLEGQTFIFNSGPPPSVALTNTLIESFSEDDLRLENWVRQVGDSISFWYHPNKYKLNSNTVSSEEFSIMIRLAEMHLIRAEANLRVGNIDQALEDLNIIRKRAGLSEIESENPTEISQAIITERRHEFFTELGHRWFDLKRVELADETLNYKPGWDDTDVLLPIPESELVVNPNLLPQNPGY